MTTYTQKLRASVAYNTDDYSLNCETIPSGVQPLRIKTSPAAVPQVVNAIVMDAAGALFFYIGPHDCEHKPSEADCRTALEWINANFDRLFS